MRFPHFGLILGSFWVCLSIYRAHFGLVLGAHRAVLLYLYIDFFKFFLFKNQSLIKIKGNFRDTLGFVPIYIAKNPL